MGYKEKVMAVDTENLELFEHHRLQVEPKADAVRIDKYIFIRLGKDKMSRTKIKEAAQDGRVQVNGKPVKQNYKIRPNDDIVILQPYPTVNKELIAQDIPLDILYEDDDLIVVNKEAGMVVHPSIGHHSGTLVNALLFHFENLPQAKDSSDRPGLVHRIDKNTSGILVIAKNEHAMTHLAAQFFDRTSDRRYRALVWGDFAEDEGTIVGHVGRNKRNRKVMDVYEDGTEGKHAVTHYKVLERFGYLTLVECKLETGRTHQIRIHFKHIGHPLFSDAEYGGDIILKGQSFTKYKQFVQNCFKILPRQALHAKTLAFEHPRTGEWMEFNSEIPDDMVQVIDKWRMYTKQRLTKS